MDSLIIAGAIGLIAVTHYRVASQITRYYIEAIVSITGIIQPVLSRLHGAQDRKNLEKVFFFATKVSLCTSVFFCFGLIFWGKPFIDRWMGPNYEDAFVPLVILSVAILFELCQYPSMSLLYATFKQRVYVYLICAEGLINIGLSVILARSMGLSGVALGTLIGAFIIRVVAQPICLCKVSGLHYSHYMKFLGGTFIRCGAVTGAAIALSSWGLRPSFPWLIASVISATIIYAAGSWLFVFHQSERKQLLAIITGPKSDHSLASDQSAVAASSQA